MPIAKSNRLSDLVSRRIVVFDGAMGTQIHAQGLDLERDYLGQENCSEVLNLTRPEVIQSIHRNFLSVGADAVETNTFGGATHVLAEFDLEDRTREINRIAAEVARAACDAESTPDRPRLAIGSMGPGTRLITLGHIGWDELCASYAEQTRGLLDGGVDALLIETCQDLLQVKAAITGSLAALDECGKDATDVPIMVQVTIETTGTMLVGSEIAAVVTALKAYPIFSLGLNCATGPVEMTDHLGYLARHWDRNISVLPNAGLPELVEGETVYPLRPDRFAEKLTEFVSRFGLNIVGGCCGTTPEHIEELAKAVGTLTPGTRTVTALPAACSSLYSPVEYRQDTSILNIGERTNASGSRKFKRLLESEDWDEMISLARGMVREGSHVIDVNVDYAGRDNARDMSEIVHRLVRQVDAPIMLDSTQIATIEAGLKQAGGKCIINSANLEEGEKGFRAMCELARRYGAGIVFGCIDDDPEEAMARTADRKVEIAARMFDIAVNDIGIDAGDIFFDPLVLPVSTGLESDRRSGLETINGTRRIREQFPLCQVTCGLSNVSFGLKPAARVVLNSVFLSELVDAGMTSAILHVSKIQPRTRIDDAIWDAALDLLYDRRDQGPWTLPGGGSTDDPLQRFIGYFPDDAVAVDSNAPVVERTLEEQLRFHVIDGEKGGLTETIDAALEVYEPLIIINEHLLEGMKTVGELFGRGEMQLPFVLQSAEVMKKAVDQLELHMEKVDGSTRGIVVLATVRGDVHDIGKNLVDIILSNNGFTVVNLGIKQPIGPIIESFEEHNADAIGLSGLLVKSVGVMEENLAELNARGITVPVLLGGAALSRHHCEGHLREKYAGEVYYGRDAFEGLRIMGLLMNGESAELETEIHERLEKRARVTERVAASKETAIAQAAAGSGGTAVAAPARSSVATDVEIPPPPFFGRRLIESVELDLLFAYVNRVALYRGQWQFRKGRMSETEYENLISDTVDPIFDRLADLCRAEPVLAPKIVYGYWPCASDGEELLVFDPDDPTREIERFRFPRQDKRSRLCLADYFRPVDADERDVLGLSCVTMGSEVSRRTKALFEADNYAEYLYLHGFGVECAEALAELWHKIIRIELGIGNDDATTVRGLFSGGYQGARYSPGYPACPDMSDQEKIFRLLRPEEIGCELTENWQIDPEQSTSAFIVHHPEAKYFNA